MVLKQRSRLMIQLLLISLTNSMVGTLLLRSPDSFATLLGLGSKTPRLRFLAVATLACQCQYTKVDIIKLYLPPLPLLSKNLTHLSLN